MSDATEDRCSCCAVVRAAVQAAEDEPNDARKILARALPGVTDTALHRALDELDRLRAFVGSDGVSRLVEKAKLAERERCAAQVVRMRYPTSNTIAAALLVAEGEGAPTDLDRGGPSPCRCAPTSAEEWCGVCGGRGAAH